MRTVGRVLAPVIAFAATMALAGCGGEVSESPAAESFGSRGEFVVERSTENGIETVRNVSGSRWGAPARLVEELSIGEEMGDEPYLFAAIIAAWATEDRIYVVDMQLPAVRAFDHQGEHLFDVGRSGQGPGEYNRPMSLTAADDGRIFVADLMSARVSVFDSDGASIEDWSLGSPGSAVGTLLAEDGALYTRIVERPDDPRLLSPTDMRMGVQPVGPGGLEGDPAFPPDIDYSPPTAKLEVSGFEMDVPIPFVPTFAWAFTPAREWIVGVGTDYRFEIHYPDGTTRIVERTWEPVPIEPAEAAFHAEQSSAMMRRMSPEFTLDTNLLPDTRPAFAAFQPDRSGRIWVLRQGPGKIDPQCLESAAAMSGFAAGLGVDMPTPETEDTGECWGTNHILDVFETASGEFLGTVAMPTGGFAAPLFVEDDTVLATQADEFGTVRLKKYRLVID